LIANLMNQTGIPSNDETFSENHSSSTSSFGAGVSESQLKRALASFREKQKMEDLTIMHAMAHQIFNERYGTEAAKTMLLV